MQTGTYKLKHPKTVLTTSASVALEKDDLIKVEAIDRYTGKALIEFDKQTKKWLHDTWLRDNAELLPLDTEGVL